MTAQICDAITDSLAPIGTAVLIEACTSACRPGAVHHKDVTRSRPSFTGVFKSDADLRKPLSCGSPTSRTGPCPHSLLREGEVERRTYPPPPWLRV